MSTQQPKPGRTTRLNAVQIERRAAWVVERWNERPSLTRARMLFEVRQKFECGKTAAEQALKRANEMIRESVADVDTSTVAAHLRRLAENAERRGKDATAAKIWEAFARVQGIDAPTRIEHSGAVASVDLDASKLSVEQLEALAALEGE